MGSALSRLGHGDRAFVEAQLGHASHRQIVGYMQPPRYAHVRGRGSSSPRPACAAAARAVASACVQQLPHLRVLAHLAPHALDLHPALAVEHAPRAQVAAAQRLVEAARGLQPEQLLDRAHVQRDLHVPLLGPLRRRRRESPLVVVHDRLPATCGNVHPVDPPAQPEPIAEVERRQLAWEESAGGVEPMEGSGSASCSFVPEPEPQLQILRLERALMLGGVLQIALQIGLQPAAQARPALQRRRQRELSLASTQRLPQQLLREPQPRLGQRAPSRSARAGLRACPSAPRAPGPRARAARAPGRGRPRGASAPRTTSPGTPPTLPATTPTTRARAAPA